MSNGMIGVIDLHNIRSKSGDLFGLRAYLQQLVGQPFLHFRFSYGDELSLHLGQPRQYASPKLKHLVQGSYVIATRASQWLLRSNSPPRVLVGSEDNGKPLPDDLKPITKQDVETSDLVQRGARIVFAEAVMMGPPQTSVFGFGLSVLLSDGSSLLIVPEAVEQPQSQDEELADWEVFTPHDRYLRVGPGAHWSYLPSRNTADSSRTEQVVQS
jgi:hypothetical protein